MNCLPGFKAQSLAKYTVAVSQNVFRYSPNSCLMFEDPAIGLVRLLALLSKVTGRFSHARCEMGRVYFTEKTPSNKEAVTMRNYNLTGA